MSNGRLALALGGGGARGVSHIGVLRVLDEAGIRPDMLVGTSIGALAACMYTAYTPDEMQERVFSFLDRNGFRKYGSFVAKTPGADGPERWSQRVKKLVGKALALQYLVFARSLFGHRRYHEAIDSVTPDGLLQEASIPTYCVCLDIASGEEIIISEGPMNEATRISANLAGFFRPIRKDGRLLVDASPVSSVPVNAARSLGATHVIGVDIRSDIPPAPPDPTGAETLMRLAVLATERANDMQAKTADVLIEPDVGDIYWSDFDKLRELVIRGEEAAEEKIEEIKKLTGR